jgi:hypothetical protein
VSFKNKTELIGFIEKQTGVTLENDPGNVLNQKRNILHTTINRADSCKVLSTFCKYGIRYEHHLGDNCFVSIK